MRSEVYLPPPIRSEETEYAVHVLATAMDNVGVDYDKAKQDICRLLGWMTKEEK